MTKQYSTKTISFFDLIDIYDVDTTDLWCEALTLEDVPYTRIDLPAHTLSDGTQLICRSRQAGLWRPGMVKEDVVNVLRERATKYWRKDPDETPKMVYVHSSRINLMGFRNSCTRSTVVPEERYVTMVDGTVVRVADYIPPNIGYIISTRVAFEWDKP